MNPKPLRYLVQFPGQCTVGYHASLGRQAENWARWTAKQYCGRLVCELNNGSAEVKGDWTRFSSEAAAEPNPDLV